MLRALFVSSRPLSWINTAFPFAAAYFMVTREVDLTLVLALVLVMTAIFDNVMIGVGLVGYEESLISGAFIGIAPLEDFAYAVAAVVLLPTLWSLLGSGTSKGRTDA